MSVPIAIYVATVLGAVAVWLLMPRERRGGGAVAVGTLLGAAAVGGLWLFLGPRLWIDGYGQDPGLAPRAMRFYYVFSALAILSAVRVITNQRPVYAALWFVMVVLASAGLFVVLSAEFMAFAMLIIYAGAILVTYVFVLMLASQSGEGESGGESGGDPRVSPLYDRVASEPAWATAAGFVLLATLLSVVFEPMSPVPAARRVSDAALIESVMPDRRNDALAARLPEAARPLANEGRLTNTERVGLDLFMGHPLAIELAGLILLVSLIGAVQIARTRVPEEEQRMRGGPEIADAAGATARPTREPDPLSPESQAQYGEASQPSGVNA